MTMTAGTGTESDTKLDDKIKTEELLSMSPKKAPTPAPRKGTGPILHKVSSY